MQQYFENRILKSYEDIKIGDVHQEGIILANERIDSR